jgi:SAM-dependent methyltransferase
VNLPKKARRVVCAWFYKTFRSGTFTFQGREFHYFYHTYHKTYENERAVEIPIVLEIVKKYRGKRLLEVGNVLSHYFPVSHEILDKYEKRPGVLNEDVVDFRPSQKYDLIVSISTLEHVGWAENPREPAKISRAIENLKQCLAPGGRMVITLPLGYNPEVDRMSSEGKTQFGRWRYLKRISSDNRWVEANWEDVRDAKYNNPYPGASGLAVIFIEK